MSDPKARISKLGVIVAAMVGIACGAIGATYVRPRVGSQGIVPILAPAFGQGTKLQATIRHVPKNENMRGGREYFLLTVSHVNDQRLLVPVEIESEERFGVANEIFGSEMKKWADAGGKSRTVIGYETVRLGGAPYGVDKYDPEWVYIDDLAWSETHLFQILRVEPPSSPQK